MAITNFIPTIWSENLYQALDKKYIAVANCSRDFEGDIAAKGSVVKICGVGDITVGDYTKNSDMNDPQTLSDTVRELTIDQAKYFNFQIDDVDRAQASPKLMDAAMAVAASALADEADKYIYALCTASDDISYENVNANNILDLILRARQKLAENNVTDFNDVVLEISPAVATVLINSKIMLDTNNSEMLSSGYLGSIAGCQIFVSNNIPCTRDGFTFQTKCLLRTKRAVAFAEQLSEVEAYRPEKRFADAVKGLHLYGAQIVYPSELLILPLTVDIPGSF